ncbi:MAG: DUF488 family protein [Kiritimatiellae bacterium]|jgi:uncharacterized protein YeaO (DUF488 family)|nr:DUF488 family protein [Kiritimatiellia bacterium]MBQ5482634.1 DUF488 family protein [Bacteroidales bacterium]MBQ3340812.1 DUF488 family protein [Kiritimatiellia bacterium]MBQ3806640.1 DUF488 family protein [Kiritimatiellia bacterium]MBQ4200148.1 DUF488 family protein [Kiritimatiellia bacterium]
MKHNLSIVRVYDIQPATPGWRVLVDRLWPRGVPKDALHPDLWAKDVAPSTELRKWFAHEEGRFDEFAARYRMELDENAAAIPFVEDVRRHTKDNDVLLLYAAKNPKCNHAIVLHDWLMERLESQRDTPKEGKETIQCTCHRIWGQANPDWRGKDKIAECCRANMFSQPEML